jgi:predicted GNAT family acetyltransferase
MSSDSKTTDTEQADITVHDDRAHSRYEVLVGGESGGGAYYQIKGDRVVFTHTEVDSKWAGKGVGSALAKAALDDVRATGRRAIPICPFITAYIRRHREYLDIVDEHYLQVFDPRPGE